MKTLFAALLLVSTTILRASDLELDFKAGWGTSYNLRINFDTGKVIYLESSTTSPKVYQLPNHENVGHYVKALLEKIPDHVGTFGDDVSVHQITFTDGKSVRKLRIGDIAYPSAIPLNEGYSAEQELENGERFIKDAPTWFLCNLLDTIVDLPKLLPKVQKP